MARKVLAAVDAAGLLFEVVKTDDGPALKFPARSNHTPEQRKLAVDVVLFAIVYPRNFGTLRRLLREREAAL